MPRRKYRSAALKSKVALEAAKGTKTLSDLSSRYGVYTLKSAIGIVPVRPVPKPRYHTMKQYAGTDDLRIGQCESPKWQVLLPHPQLKDRELLVKPLTERKLRCRVRSWPGSLSQGSQTSWAFRQALPNHASTASVARSALQIGSLLSVMSIARQTKACYNRAVADV
jgi:hypothetical protein